MEISIKSLQKDNISQLVELAKPIWEEHYIPIIGKQQVTYMLDKFQSEQAVNEQLIQGYEYYLVSLEGQLMGYFSIQLREDQSLFISKFYLSKKARGRKIGTAMLDFINTAAKDKNCKTLALTVNKYNPAYQVYLKLGFSNVGSVEADIGEGYIMDDYLMEKELK